MDSQKVVIMMNVLEVWLLVPPYNQIVHVTIVKFVYLKNDNSQSFVCHLLAVIAVRCTDLPCH